MKTWLLLLVLLIPCRFGYAQGSKEIISGKVTDPNGLPIAGATITVNGTGTASDEKGNYTLKLTPGTYKITVTMIGYASYENQIIVGGDPGKQLSVQLDPSSELLQETVVSGVKFKSATATRTLMQIQDIPQSIAVIGQRVINQQAATDMSIITRNISGLNFTGNYSGAGSYQFFNARGFDLNDSQNYRWNGMMIWNLGNNYSDNIEQVEFLKGPTSILFGDVSPGGVLNMVTKKPLADFMAKAEFKTGSWGLIRPSIDVTGSVTKDHSLRFRINSSFEKRNSFREYVTSEQSFIAPSISWDINKKLTLNLETVFKKSQATDDAGLVSPDGTIKGLDKLNPSQYLGEPSRKYLYNDQTYSGNLTYEISNTWRLKATGLYGNTFNRPFGIWFDQPDLNGDFLRREYGYRQHSKNGSLSLNAYGTFYTGSVKHNVLFGGEFQSTNFRFTNVGSLSPLDSSNVFKPKVGQSIRPEPASRPYQPYTSLIGRAGVYLQDQVLMFDEKLHVLLGMRAGRTKQGIDYDESKLPGTDYEGYTDDIINKNILTPRVGFVYKPKLWSSIFASWSKGYEINSPDIFAKNYLQYSSPPATISTQLEFGLKANFLDERLGVTLSAFEIKKDHPYGYTYLDPINPNYDEYNVYYEGRHRSRGIEADIDGQLSPGLSLIAGAAYTRTRVMNDPGYPEGNVLPNAPKITANAWLNFQPVRHLSGFSASAGIFFKSKFYSSIANDPHFEIPSGYTIDGSLGYTHKRLGVQLNAMNLTNQVSYLNPWQFNLFDVKPLRQFILTVRYSVDKRLGH